MDLTIGNLASNRALRRHNRIEHAIKCPVGETGLCQPLCELTGLLTLQGYCNGCQTRVDRT
jgi:hypothetical protein